MKYELIITEKPAAAKKIAEALADGKSIKESINKVPYYKITRGKRDIIVACAVGHLYGLKQKGEKKWTFPVFEIEWKPTAEVQKASSFTKKYLAVIKKLAKDADEFTVATDYDIEGEVIGLNIIKYACKKKDANRMKFSTLTKEDLIEAYKNKSKHLDWPQAEAGETRHKLDWFYGINTSRALTSAIKTAGMFQIMSTGRVQGPALKLIVDKEKQILAFKPVPYWEIQLDGEKDKQLITALHEKGKFQKKPEAEKIYKNIKDEKSATIIKAEKKQFKQAPPNPFDLTSLQIEAYKTVKITPKHTLAIAQELYTSGYISYPRTSSQQLPEKIGYKKILNLLSKKYPEQTKFLLSKPSLIPNNGKKTDPAHPAIYPTGIIPKTLEKQEYRIYDLIVKRFFATFGDQAVRETLIINIDCKKEIFITKGTTTLIQGWFKLYEPYVMLKEEELPILNKGDKINVKKILLLDKETKPPKRYTEASIIKELEKHNLGTKATRAQIIDTLFHRNYVEGKQIKATELGIRTCKTLLKYSPKILDEKLTRHFEEEMEEIIEKKRHEKEILEEAKQVLIKIMDEFKAKEKQIGKELGTATKETREEINTVGKCPNCKGTLIIRRGKYGYFVACNQYPKCKTTISLPSNALIKPSKNICKECGQPTLLAIRKAKRPQEICINPKCRTKKGTKQEEKEAEEIKNGKIEKECPRCGKSLVLRKSLYGKFLGCSGYPKCRYTEKIIDGPLKEDFKKKKQKI